MSESKYTPPEGSREIPSAPGYRVCDGGVVWSCWSTNGTMSAPWHTRKPQLDDKGYLRVELLIGRERHLAGVHQLVLEAFVGPCPPDMEGCHNDGNPANNFVRNLRWDTYENNRLDMIRHGRSLRGERCHFARLKASDIPTIFRMSREGLEQWEIAEVFNVSPGTVSNVLIRKTWAHVPLEDDGRNNRRSPQGESHGMCRFKQADVIEMFRLARAGKSQNEIARIFGAKQGTISNILRRKSWKSVVIPEEFLPSPR